MPASSTPISNRGVNLNEGAEMNRNIAAKLIDVGIDWLTLTTKESSRGVEWHAAFEGVAAQEKARGHKWKEARWFGYAGEACGHAFWGVGNQGWMVRLSSYVAEEAGYLFSPEEAHTTRIDIQVTAELTYPDPGLIERMYKEAVLRKTTNGRPCKLAIIVDNAGGRTLYVGSRTSGLFGRVYDKGIEQGGKEPGKIIRWELECKDWAAAEAVARLYPSTMPDRQMLSIVGDFFMARSVAVPWAYMELEEGFRAPRLVKDDIQTLRWLEGPVATATARLMDVLGPEMVLRALLTKWHPGNSDRDIIGEMVQVVVD
jgi:hypothetical protein